MKEKNIYDIMICPKCKSDNVSQYDVDEIDFDIDNTGHYYFNCYCCDCQNHFRLYMKFQYKII